MAVVKLSEYLHIGLAADTKPATAVLGAHFIEYDHHHLYVFDGTWRDIEQVTNDSAHQHIHNGEMWMISAIAEGVSNNADMDMLYTTPAQEMHTTFQLSAEGDAQIFIFEDATTSGGGTAATVKNSNRTIGDAGAPTVLVGPTITGDGTQLLTQAIAGGRGGNAPGGNAERNSEIVLKASTNYLFRVTNTSGSASDLSIVLLSYEHG